ncbi:MAG: sulfate adenylyltransferase subunit CysN [Gammaproteobacteria bacterium]|nr:sulfate adenylyltransferase subunit CysN [Pseudomonadales bacterium]MCP5346621.1 sulfate adenylyltransferase subunit CysN [Pseudomonadales bacterium]
MLQVINDKQSSIEKVKAYIENQAGLDQLRFITCGSVDDGKSTLIGRMLYEAQSIFEDQIAALESDSKKLGTQGGAIDFALLVDGLAAEREQGITIDVAYRYFNTDRRKFIVADTPGHEQFTRNMVTGASHADVAVILIDASQGVLTQTRRHSFITSLLGIKHVVLAVNKMDLVNFRQDVFDRIVEDYKAFAGNLEFQSITPIPMSALLGDNVVERSAKTSWYQGPTLLGFLETIEITHSRGSDPFRFPVQWVNRPNADFRGYCGKIVSGKICPGDKIRVLPSGELASIESIKLYSSEMEEAVTDQSITLTLDRDVDISRGDVIVSADAPCEVSDQFETSLVWMDAEAGFVGRSYWLMIGTHRVNATVTEIKYKYNINTFEKLQSRSLELNDIGKVTVSLDQPIPFEAYSRCKELGAFVLVDRYSFATVGAGMINFSLRRAKNVHRQALSVDKEARARLNGHRPQVLWFTGLSGSGKSTVANAVEQALHRRGVRTYILDGDNIRHGLNKDLGFTDADRVENIRRIAEVARLMVDAGLVVLTAFISPFRSERDMARALFEAGEFVEIHIDVPLEIAEQRDPKGLYKKARKGELPNFTGIDSAYEAPDAAELILRTGELSVDECVERVLNALEAR